MSNFRKLSWENVSVSAKQSNGSYKPIFEDVSGNAEAGKIHLILGESRSGKTTLINTLTGSVPNSFKTVGEILLDDAKDQMTFYCILQF